MSTLWRGRTSARWFRRGRWSIPTPSISPATRGECSTASGAALPERRKIFPALNARPEFPAKIPFRCRRFPQDIRRSVGVRAANAWRPVMIRTPYLLFLGDAPDQLAAKVAQGIADWRPEHVVGQLRLPGCKADVGAKDMTLAEAYDAGARTLVIGVANRGGVFSDAWLDVMVEAMETGFDIASGLHSLLRNSPTLRDAAERTGRTLHDVRIPTVSYPIANGAPRSGKRCLAVGTDCSVGKMYTGLAMDAEMKARGMKSSFRPTGQTGILITGEGIPLDAVIADFMAGSVEWLTPDNDPDHSIE